jgi:predicted AAA+ superfamily ATPase
MAADCGVTHNTAKAWLSILEASYVLFLMQPHHNNLGKRLVKTPKLYFFDSGLLTWLLGIKSADQLIAHPNRGMVFETYIVSEFIKHTHNRGEVPSCFFWRDRSGNEVDLLIEDGTGVIPIEIKSGKTVASDWFRGLKRYSTLASNLSQRPQLVYGGEQTYMREGCRVKSWREAGGKT